MKKNIKVCLLIILILLILGIYLYYENTTLETTYYEIINDKIPRDFNNFKIIQISDYHNENSKRLNKALVNKINEEKPNIIVITGDLIDSKRTNVNIALEFIQTIKNVAQIYYVTGNHEDRTEDYRILKEGLLNQGIRILENETEVISRNNSFINLIGINDSNSEYSCENKLNISNYSTDAYNILLSHRPELFEIYIKSNIDLVFTGHAHGGQFRIPFIGGVVAPNQGVFPKYTSGIFIQESTTMIVSRGIGNSIIPFRINNNPELVVVTLKSK